MTSRVTLRRIALVPAWLVLLSGCRHMAKARQCRDSARAVNKGLDEIAGMKGAGSEQPAALHKAAARYEKLAGEAKRTRPTQNVELGKTVDELASLFHQTAQVLGQLADAKQAHETRRVDLERRRVDSLARREKTQARRVDAFCTATE